jgi:hypothetical protein
MRLDPLTRGLIERGGIVGGRKIILACDELTELLSRDSVEGMISHLLKSGTVGFMTTATPEEYKALVAKDPALDARMNIVEMLDHGTRVRRTCDALVKAFQEGSEKPVPIMKTLPLTRPKMAL